MSGLGRFRRLSGWHAVCLLSVLFSATACGANQKKSNVIYVFSDEHRWQSMSFTEMPQARTPNLQTLGEQGCRFVPHEARGAGCPRGVEGAGCDEVKANGK